MVLKDLLVRVKNLTFKQEGNNKVEKQSLFSVEEKTLEHAEKIQNDEKYKDAPLINEFSKLLKGYKRIFKQLRRLIKLSDKQQHSLAFELEQAFESFIRTLATTIDAKHKLTAGHSTRVTEYALFLGQFFNLSDEELEVLKYAGLLHDIGKIGIPDAVLTKCGRFTPEERAIMNEHAVWTDNIVGKIRLPRNLKEVPRMAACHHEKMDGTGYPYGLKKDEIPFFARLLAVGDVFDALTSKRDYPKYDKDQELGLDAMSMDRAFSILEKDQNTHFDPDIIKIVLEKRPELEKLWQRLHTEEQRKNETIE